MPPIVARGVPPAHLSGMAGLRVSFTAILFLALGLAMDATAVALAKGLTANRVRVRDVLLVAGLFGGSQAAMPALGWLLGHWVGAWLEAWDHWIAFGLLGFLGVRMIRAAWSEGEDDDATATEPFALGPLSLLALATSIDAFAVGMTLPLLDAPFVLTLATIGIVTAVLSGAAVRIGRRLGEQWGPRLEALGGFVLIGLGVKILVEHLTA